MRNSHNSEWFELCLDRALTAAASVSIDRATLLAEEADFFWRMFIWN